MNLLAVCTILFSLGQWLLKADLPTNCTRITWRAFKKYWFWVSSSEILVSRCVVVPESANSSPGAGLGWPGLGNTHLGYPAHLSKLTFTITYSRKTFLTVHFPFPTIMASPHLEMDEGPLLCCPLAFSLPSMLHTMCAETLCTCLDLLDSPLRQNVISSYLYAQCLG